jgi:hypothetical protein
VTPTAAETGDGSVFSLRTTAVSSCSAEASPGKPAPLLQSGPTTPLGCAEPMKAAQHCAPPIIQHLHKATAEPETYGHLGIAVTAKGKS